MKAPAMATADRAGGHAPAGLARAGAARAARARPAPAYSATNGAVPAALRILTVSALVPVAEEWFFRGRLLPWLDEAWRGRRWGRGAAVTLSTLAFAAAHGEPAQALFAVPLGLLL